MQTAIRPVFIANKNVRNFNVLMDALALSAGEGRLGMVTGRAGRGKTRTAIAYAAQHACIYLRMATVWRTSELEFLRALCRELGMEAPPKRKGPAYSAVCDALSAAPRPIFLDELEKLPAFFLDVVRDISDMSSAPFVLIGEAELSAVCQRNRRVWSRVYQSMQFEPIGQADIILYVREATGLAMPPQAAAILHHASGGDFRLVRRDTVALVQIAQAKGVQEITEDMAKTAVKTGLQGR